MREGGGGEEKEREIFFFFFGTERDILFMQIKNNLIFIKTHQD